MIIGSRAAMSTETKWWTIMQASHRVADSDSLPVKPTPKYFISMQEKGSHSLTSRSRENNRNGPNQQKLRPRPRSRCPTDSEDRHCRLAGWISTFKASGIEAKEGGGWNEKPPQHTTYAETIESGDARTLKVKQAKDRIDKLIEVGATELEFDPAMQELMQLIGDDEACAHATGKLKRKLAQDQVKLAANQETSLGMKGRRNHSGVG